jgi:hypothetical protein
MRLVLSRKGFDTTAGGRASPILPDGTLVSFPIPEPRSDDRPGFPYARIPCGGFGAVADVAPDLGVGRHVLARGAHVDPDLEAGPGPRPPGWRAAFGQAGAAEAHLRNQGVGPGDLFVFFGLFRRTVEVDGRLRWDPSSSPEHVVFGWLTVGEVVRAGTERWATLLQTHGDHPHVTHPYGPNNTVYLAADRCALDPERPGAGTCGVWSPARRLTAPGSPSPTRWRLPIGCHPDRSGQSLSYHHDPDRWTTDGDHTRLRSVGRGQEFVVDATDAWQDWALQALRGS